MKIVYVRWRDATTLDDWHEPDVLTGEGMECESVGFLTAEDDDFIALSRDCTPEGPIRATVQIPTSWIIERRALTKKGEKRVDRATEREYREWREQKAEGEK